MKAIVLKGGRVVTAEGVIRRDVVVRNGRVELGGRSDEAAEVLEIGGQYVLPGFVDIHFHGYDLFDFSGGRYDAETGKFDRSAGAFAEGLGRLREQLAGFGVTGFYVASFAAEIETLRYCFGRLADYRESAAGQETSRGARLRGGLLEGTFISPEMAGAQNPALVFEPAREVFERIEDRGTIKLANVVPDFGRESCRLTEYLTKKGVVVGLGHTNATCRQVAEAMKAGLKYCIHFTNGPTGGSYKPFEGGGATEAVLQFDELYAELICDGYHVNPAYIRDIVARKGYDRIIGVSDCMFIAGSELKRFSSGGVQGAVSEDGSHLRVVGKNNVLFGSNLTMVRGFANMLNWLTCDMGGIWYHRHAGLGLEAAVTAAAKMFASNPCRLLGLDEQGFGTIAEGAAADLCVLEVAGAAGEYRCDVRYTIVDGQVVYRGGQCKM